MTKLENHPKNVMQMIPILSLDTFVCKWIIKMYCMRTMDYYPALKRNGIDSTMLLDSI